MFLGKNEISFNSPVVLTFAFLCFASLVAGAFTGGASTALFFSVYRSSFLDPLTYIRFFTHVLGHADWNHFFGNMTMLLVVGPLLEEKYNSANLLSVILTTALVTGIIHFILFPGTVLLGASGVVFAFILLSSITSFEKGKIPMTFVLVAVIYLGQQIYSAIFVQDNISNLTHLAGGITGAVLGFKMNRMNRRHK